jgi:hypothetical protein
MDVDVAQEQLQRISAGPHITWRSSSSNEPITTSWGTMVWRYASNCNAFRPVLTIWRRRRLTSFNEPITTSWGTMVCSAHSISFADRASALKICGRWLSNSSNSAHAVKRWKCDRRTRK